MTIKLLSEQMEPNKNINEELFVSINGELIHNFQKTGIQFFHR